MGLWGLITATGRVVHFGLDAWFEVAIRLVHVGVPLALFIYWSREKEDLLGEVHDLKILYETVAEHSSTIENELEQNNQIKSKTPLICS